MPTTRTTELVSGKEFSIAIKKTAMVIIGCASSVEYSGQKEVLAANCQSGKKKIPSGDNPDYTITVQGFYMIYLSANVATNVSATEIESYMQLGTKIEYIIAAPNTGDPTRAGFGYITAFSFSAPVDGLATYNYTITPYDMPVLGVVA